MYWFKRGLIVGALILSPLSVQANLIPIDWAIDIHLVEADVIILPSIDLQSITNSEAKAITTMPASDITVLPSVPVPTTIALFALILMGFGFKAVGRS